MIGDTKWLRWLRGVTHESTVRGIARKVGVSHTQVGRWVEKGVPPDKVWEITIRFQGDPVVACVVLGYIAEDEVSKLNYGAVVEYIPTCYLTAEMNKRAQLASKDPANVDRHRLSVAV